MPLHVFVAMPFGIKDGIDFDRVYSDYIKPALEGEGYEVFRGDEEIATGNIRPEMLQELLLADVVVADLSANAPNVWYELGVRHALRARGVVQLDLSARQTMPFDVYTDRKLRYHTKDGVPDPALLEEDRRRLRRLHPFCRGLSRQKDAYRGATGFCNTRVAQPIGGLRRREVVRPFLRSTKPLPCRFPHDARRIGSHARYERFLRTDQPVATLQRFGVWGPEKVHRICLWNREGGTGRAVPHTCTTR